MEKFRLAGIIYPNKDGHSRTELLKACSWGDVLHFKRDPLNKFDKNAILVMTEADHDIGFVPRELAKKLAHEIDIGTVFMGHLEGDEVRYCRVEFNAKENKWFMLINTLISSGRVFDQTIRKCEDSRFRYLLDMETFVSDQRILLFVVTPNGDLRTVTICLSKSKEVLIGIGDFDKNYYSVSLQSFLQNHLLIMESFTHYFSSKIPFHFGVSLSHEAYLKERATLDAEAFVLRSLLLRLYSQSEDLNHAA